MTEKPMSRFDEYTESAIFRVEDYPSPTEAECEIALQVCDAAIKIYRSQWEELGSKIFESRVARQDWVDAQMGIKSEKK